MIVFQKFKENVCMLVYNFGLKYGYCYRYLKKERILKCQAVILVANKTDLVRSRAVSTNSKLFDIINNGHRIIYTCILVGLFILSKKLLQRRLYCT
jgi:hypothetical protein